MLPNEFLRITRFARLEDQLRIRFVTEYRDEVALKAFEVIVRGAGTTPQCADLLESPEARELIVSASIDDARLVIRTNDECECEVRGSGLEINEDSLTENEFLEVLEMVVEWQRRESSALSASLQRVNALRDLLSEQIRRVETKAQGHQANSAAGIIYAQNLRFLRRALEAIET